MSEEKLEAWREIITTSAITSIALVKILTAKGLVNESEILEAIEETKKELGARQP